MSMKFEPKVCPTCGEPFRAIPQTVSGYSDLSYFEDTGVYEWEGTTNYEEHVSVRDAEGRIIAECLNGHRVPVADLAIPEAQRLEPPPKQKVWVIPCIYGGVVNDILLFTSEKAAEEKQAELCEANEGPKDENGNYDWNEEEDIGFPIWEKTIPDPDAEPPVHSAKSGE